MGVRVDPPFRARRLTWVDSRPEYHGVGVDGLGDGMEAMDGFITW